MDEPREAVQIAVGTATDAANHETAVAAPNRLTAQLAPFADRSRYLFGVVDRRGVPSGAEEVRGHRRFPFLHVRRSARLAGSASARTIAAWSPRWPSTRTDGTPH